MISQRLNNMNRMPGIFTGWSQMIKSEKVSEKCKFTLLIRFLHFIWHFSAELFCNGILYKT